MTSFVLLTIYAFLFLTALKNCWAHVCQFDDVNQSFLQSNNEVFLRFLQIEFKAKTCVDKA